MILFPAGPLACYNYNEPAPCCMYRIPSYADSSSMEVVSSPLPVETSADVASPCFDRTGSVQVVLHMPSAVAKAIVKRPQSAAGGTRYACNIWSGGTDYSAVDSPGGPLSRGDCPRRDSLCWSLDSRL